MLKVKNTRYKFCKNLLEHRTAGRPGKTGSNPQHHDFQNERSNRMIIGIPKESIADETRVATTPNTVRQLKKLGFDVSVESGAGEKASFTDEAYRDAGAVAADRDTVWRSDLIYKLNSPDEEEIAKIKEGSTLVSFLYPALHPELVDKLSGKKINVLAMDMVPRISRAQSLDALSSMANIGGYRAVIEAANHFGRFFIGQITAAGKVPPAKVLVIGAGVAGLAAIGHPPAPWEPSSGPSTPALKWRNRSNPWAVNF